MKSGRRLYQLLVAPAVAGALLVLSAGPAAAAPAPKVLLSGLSSPKGLAVTPDGDLVIGQGAFGPPGPVLLYRLHGKARGTTVALTDPVNAVDVAVARDGTGWAIGSDAVLYRARPGKAAVAVLNIRAFQASHPDPFNTEGSPTESNPYGLAVLPGGDALVADAANNSVLRVTPGGRAWIVARFKPQSISTSHIGDPNLPPTIPAEAVPTSIALGPGGDVLVGQLMGFPFTPRTSKVWRLDPDARNAVCSRQSRPSCSVYASRLTAINDIAYDRRTGTLYVYELAAAGVLAFEAGFQSGQFPPAVLLKVRQGTRTELARGQLSQPGGVVVGPESGQVFVTDGVFTSGRLLRVTR